MQSVSSVIWTRVAVSISYNNNHYATSYIIYIYEVVYIYPILDYTDKNIINNL